MRYAVFDIETQNTFDDVGKYDPSALDISVACAYDSGTNAYVVAKHDELANLWPIFEAADAIIGYNSNHFDIPLMNKYYPGDLLLLRSIDLLENIKNSIGKRLRLDSVAEATLGSKKNGHGLQAIVWWRQGEIEKLKEYCRKDVQLTKELFEYALKNKTLKYREGGALRIIPIDTSTWETGESHAMTHSLPF